MSRIRLWMRRYDEWMDHPMPTEPWRESLDDSRGWRAVARRVFGGSENPLLWGISLYTAWGIRVRIHLLFPVFIAARLIQTVLQDQAGLMFVGPLMVALVVLVLLHEYGHCFVCRRVGGEADEILLWPLGGLATCSPPHRWDAAFWTTAGGPLVNAALLVPLGALVFALTGSWGAVIFNPFDPWFSAGTVTASTDFEKLLKLTAWAFHYSNMLLLAFNVLVPMYPMDGGRLLHALLWRKIGYRESTKMTAIIGLVVAGVMAVFAVVFSELLLLGLALFGGLMCYTELQRLKFEADGDDSVFAVSLAMTDEEDEPTRAEKRASKEAAVVASEQAEIDRILAKISSGGVESLSRAERRTLDRASKKGRGGS